MPKRFIYKNVVAWQGEKKGQLTAQDKDSLMVATPPEFRGHPGIWSPEDLFVAAVNGCIMTTFLYFIEQKNIQIASYESEAEGVLEIKDKWLVFSQVNVKPTVVVNTPDQVKQVEDILLQSEKKCLISKSIKAEVTVIPDIKMANQ